MLAHRPQNVPVPCWLVLAAAVVALAAALVTAGPVVPAEAYTCQTSNYRYLSDSVSLMDITVQRNCSDGRSHVFGKVEDTWCDNRSARGRIEFHNGGNPIAYRTEYVFAHGGCGTYASFAFSSTNPSPRVHAYVCAINGLSESSGAGGWV